MENPTYLGDGAYATFTEWGEVLVTANHHDPARASDTVSIDADGMKALFNWYGKMQEARDANS